MKSPSSARDWASWLQLQENQTRQVYLTKPIQLIADYNREKQITKDYQDREILELLQNAADAAADINSRARVLIELSTIGLIVANTGAPFSQGGVESLQNSHLSPKRRRDVAYLSGTSLAVKKALTHFEEFESNY